MPRTGPPWPGKGLLAAAGWAVLAGCSTERYVRDADAEVGALLRSTTKAALAGREGWVQQPRAAVPPEPADQDEAAGGEEPPGPPNVGEQTIEQSDDERDDGDNDGKTLRLDLKSSLLQAVTAGRDYIDQQEALYLQGLGLTLARFQFGPLLDATIAHVWGDSDAGPANATLSGTFGLDQVLPLGGTASLDAALSKTRSEDPPGMDPDERGLISSSVSFDLTQPLLRGAGYEVSHEPLTQAERNIVYAVRAFELFRENFSISIASDYFRLVGQKKRLVNLEQDLGNAVFDKRQAEALRTVGRNRDEDVFLARRRAIDAENTLLVAQTNYERALDTFKIRIGLPVHTDMEIVEEEPEFKPVRLDPQSAVDVALRNRLDLITERERLQDVERAVRLARDGLLPDLGLALSYGLTGSESTLGRAAPGDSSVSAGLTFTVPVQRTSERNVYRSALIARDRAYRDFELFEANVERDTVNKLRELQQVEDRIALQEQQIAQEERNIVVSLIRNEAGELDSRDLLDARQAHVDAENRLIDLKTDHFISRLELMRDLGLLFIDDQGRWRP